MGGFTACGILNTPRSSQTGVLFSLRPSRLLPSVLIFIAHKVQRSRCSYMSSFFFLPSHLLFSPFYSLPPSRNSDPGSHGRLFSPPPHYGSCLALLSREDFSSSLVDSRRIVLTHARRSQQLILFSFLQIDSKSRHGGIRTHGPTRLIVAFEGYH